MFRWVCSFLLLVCLMTAPNSFAATIHVPADQLTIQAAANVAADDDSIVVGPGIYHENASFSKVVHLVSEQGPDNTIIESAANAQRIISYDRTSSLTFTLSGFTIRGARDADYAVLIRGCNLAVIGNRVTDNRGGSNLFLYGVSGEIRGNEVWGNSGGDCSGIWCTISSTCVVTNNVIHGNTASACSGIMVDGAGTVSISRNLIFDNVSNNGCCGGMINAPATLTIVENNTITGNNTGPSDVALWLAPASFVRNNIVTDNIGCYAVGFSGGPAVSDFNDFYNNTLGSYHNLSGGGHDISANPLFVNAGGADYILQPGSPCINAGDPNPIYNDPDGTRNDMGAFPYIPPNQPPVIAPVGNKTAFEGDTLQFTVTATDPDSTIPFLTAVGLPTGATFIDNGNGTGNFHWIIAAKQYGTFNISFIASDSVLADTETVDIQVSARLPQVADLSIGGSNMPMHVTAQVPTIAWQYIDFANDDPQFKFEVAVGTDTDWTYSEMWNPAPLGSSDTSVVYNGSPLADGATYWLRLRVNNSLAWSGWKQLMFRMNSIPGVPVPRTPSMNGMVASLTPALTIKNSTDSENDSLFYTCQVSPDSFTSVIYTFAKKQDPDSLTTITVDSTLTENARYWWRVKASDYYEESGYSATRSFYVNASNTPPLSPDLLSPANTIAMPITTLLPQFSWTASTDVDPFDSVSYTFYIAIDSNFVFANQVVGLVATSHTLTDSLQWSRRYWWKVKAADQNGGATWSNQVFTFRIVTPGDADNNGVVSLSDVVFLVNYIFVGGAPPQPLAAGDPDCSGKINLSDAVFLVNYVFGDGAPPCGHF